MEEDLLRIKRQTNVLSVDGDEGLQWILPEDILEMLEAVAEILNFRSAAERGRSPPNRHYREIVIELVRALFHDTSPRQMRDAYRSFSTQEKAYLVHIVTSSLVEIRRRQIMLPDVPLGLPLDNLNMWSKILQRTWRPLPSYMRYHRRQPPHD
ncbi:hypothetical protein [Labrys monachus]|uniref:Uncharacterized protein n=1 Tax=Labrys monachus TaxID=217067 RepID=A0ABU0FL98_9HYPH|nr:hypothetical protein [Labrys monachus]MDQ0394878.1 hypothetical protein [Labrys monachus]